jgi:hypothetical protein
MHGSMNIKSDEMLGIFRHFRKIVKNDYKFRHACPFLRLSASIRRIFMNSDIWVFNEN